MRDELGTPGPPQPDDSSCLKVGNVSGSWPSTSKSRRVRDVSYFGLENHMQPLAGELTRNSGSPGDIDVDEVFAVRFPDGM